MKRPVFILLIVLGALVFIGLLYYFLIYKPSQKRSGSTIDDIGNSGNTSSLQSNDLVYLKGDSSAWTGNHGIPIYRQPIADSIGSFLEGVTRGEWYAGQPIGKVKEIKIVNGEIPWIKVGVNNLKIWKYIVNSGYTTQVGNLTGDYWVRENALFKL